MKRWTHIFLIVCMVLLLPAVSIAARAADTAGACGDNLTWTFDEATGTLTIDGTGPMWDWEWDGTPWYDYCSAIKSVILSDGVSSIGDYAFAWCDNLTKVNLSNSVTSFGRNAFSSCEDLPEVIIPDNVTFIGDEVFSDCYNLAKVTIPSSVTNLGNRVFRKCWSLTKVIIPDSVISIGEGVFLSCTALTEVTLPDSIASIDASAFGGCYTLTEITIPDGVISIGDFAFSNCHNLTTVTMPNSVTSIDSFAFIQCFSLTDVYYIGTEVQWKAIDIENDNDSLLNATIHFAFDPETGAVFIRPLPEGAESALIAAYADGKLVCSITGQVGNDNCIPLAAQPDEIRIFYLGDNYQPMTTPDIIRLN